MTLVDSRDDAANGDKTEKLHHFSVIVDMNHPESLVSTAFPILHCIRPKWDITDIDYQFLVGGLTNKILCFWNRFERNQTDRILLRIYDSSTELIIDRRCEYACMLLLHDHDLSAPLYCSFANGNAYGFVPGETATLNTVRDPHIASLIAKRMAKLHSVKVPKNGMYEILNEQRPLLFKGLEKFAALVQPTYDDPRKQAQFNNQCLSIVDMYKEMAFLEGQFAKMDSPVVFCHNDLLLGNVIYDKKTDSVGFIDFEYAGFNYQSFDIANHFVEFAGTANVDFNRYPDESYRRLWLKIYLDEFSALNNLPPCSENDVSKLDNQVQTSVAATHLFWAVWAVVQSQNSNIDYDYLSYGVLRFKEYVRTKQGQ